MGEKKGKKQYLVIELEREDAKRRIGIEANILCGYLKDKSESNTYTNPTEQAILIFNIQLQ